MTASKNEKRARGMNGRVDGLGCARGDPRAPSRNHPAAQEQSQENFFERVWPEKSDHTTVYLVPAHISPNHTTFHISLLRAVHLGLSGVAIPVPLPLPLYPHSTPFPPLFQVVLGRPFWAVHLGPSGAPLTQSLPLKLTPTLVNHAHGSSLHNIHHLSSLWAVDLGRQEQHYQSLFSFPFPLPLSEWVETVQVGPSEAQPAITVGRERKKRGEKKNLYSLTPPSPSSSRL